MPASSTNGSYRNFWCAPPGNNATNLDPPILSWSQANSAPLADIPKLGHIYVEDALGILLLDMHAASRQTVRLFLPVTRPLFIRRADEASEYVLDAHGVVPLSTLRQQSVAITEKGALHLAFEKLFKAPFGMANVAAFEKSYDAKFGPQPTVTVLHKDSGTKRKRWRTAAFGVASGALVLGLSSTIWGIASYRDAKGGSHLDAHQFNRSIQGLNAAAISFYALAGATGIAYLILKLLPEKKRTKVTVLPAVVGPFSSGTLLF